MSTRDDADETRPRLGRRGVLRGGATAVALGAGAGVAGTATAQSSFGGWLDGVGNYDGSVVDRTGRDSVTITVGAEGNGGAFAFDPPAVRVDPGTEVVWEWTGDGGQHNVVAEEGGSFESQLTAESGFTFSQTFDAEGTIKYYCAPHRSLEMKGVVVVGSGGAGSGGSGSGGEPDYGGWMSDVGNYDGTVDRRGQSQVTVAVGAEGNGGAFAFDPPAVWVDPGTEVVWEWTGEGGQHNVVAEEGGSFESQLTAESGFTFSQTFEESGVVTYYCGPHRSLGMKGAVAVGDVPTTSGGGGTGGDGGGGGEPAAGGTGVSIPGGSAGFVGYLLALGLPGIAAATILFGEFYGSLGEGEYGDVSLEAPAAAPAREIGHDEYDPVGTASLVLIYFVILGVMWVFVYFVEFLGNGPTIIG